MKLLIIIPARNEAMTIGSVIDSTIITGCRCEDILVVNDDSQDNTASIARGKNIKVMDLPIHLGAWGGIQAGMRYAIANNYDAAVTLDADGQHEAQQIHLLTAKLGEYDIVTGAHIQRGGIGKKLIWWTLRNFSGLDCTDLTSGFRAYSQNAMKLLIDYESLLIDYQDVGVLLLCKNNGFKATEVLVSMHQRQHGNSRVFKNWVAIARYLIQTFILIGAKRW